MDEPDEAGNAAEPAADRPPGWFADPYGEAAFRWWDGCRWTTHTRAGRPTEPPQQRRPAGRGILRRLLTRGSPR